MRYPILLHGYNRGGEQFTARIECAAEAYMVQAGKIYFFGMDRHNGKPSGDYVIQVLSEFGVPNEDIIVSRSATNTAEEVCYFLAMEPHVERYRSVTTTYHAERVELIYSWQLGEKNKNTPVSVETTPKGTTVRDRIREFFAYLKLRYANRSFASYRRLAMQ